MGGVGRGPCRKEKGSWKGCAKMIFEEFLEAVAQTHQVSKRFRRTVSRSSEPIPEITRGFCPTREKLCRSSAAPEIQTHALPESFCHRSPLSPLPSLAVACQWVNTHDEERAHAPYAPFPFYLWLPSPEKKIDTFNLPWLAVELKE